MMSWDVCFEIEAEKNYGDQREISQDFLDFVIVEEEEEELSIIEEKFAPILRELIRMGREIDIDLKEIKRRIKTIASNADKIKGGVDSEIGMRSVATTMTKTKLDIIKERAGIIKMTEELKIKMANAGTGCSGFLLFYVDLLRFMLRPVLLPCLDTLKTSYYLE